jgi:hypothetical protein
MSSIGLDKITPTAIGSPADDNARTYVDSGRMGTCRFERLHVLPLDGAVVSNAALCR